MHTHHKSARLEARITPEQKHQVEHAAHLLGRSITDFTISTLQEAAIKVIRQHDIITLSMDDQQAFTHALFNAPEPSHRLLNAKKHFDEQIKHG